MATANDGISTVTTDLNIKEKVDFLFKNYLGFPNTKQGLPYYNEESAGTSNNYLDGDDIFMNPLPKGTDVTFTKIYDSAESLGDTDEVKARINIPDSVLTANPNIKVYEDSTKVILKYENVPLVAVPNTTIATASGPVTQTYYIPGRDDDGNADVTKNVLHDTIQANVEQYYDDEGSLQKPYGYRLVDSNSNPISAGKFGGNFIVDVKNGLVNFTDIESDLVDGTKGTIHSRLNAGVPTISFSKYGGKKGIASVFQASADGVNTFQDISVNRVQTNQISIGSNFADLSAGILLDLCANRFLDGSAAIVLPKGTTAQRPWQNGNSDYDAAGALRYNIDTKQFEGFSSESWQGLGGVTDIDQVTKITAAHDPTDEGQDRRLRFFVDGSLNMVFDGSGNVAIGYNYDTNDQNAQGTGFSGTDVSFNNNTNFSLHGDMSMNGVLYVPTLDVNSDIDAAATTKFVKRAISNLIANAPDTLDTLEEIANVLGDPANDPSGNSAFSVLRKIQDLSDNIDGMKVNANMQKLFEIQTQQPGKFNETDHDEKAGAITLKWSYNDIRATHSNVKANLGLRAHMTNVNDEITSGTPSTSSENVEEVADFGIKAAKLPYIHQLHIDISGVPQTEAEIQAEGGTAPASWDASRNEFMNGSSGKWMPLTGVSTVQLVDSLGAASNRLDINGNIVLQNNEDYDTQKFRKLIIGKVPPSSKYNSPIENLLSRDFPQEGHKFDIRIYGTNFSENFPTVDDRALVFKDLSFATAGTPVVSSTTNSDATNDNSNTNNGTYNLDLDSVHIERSEQDVSGSTAKVIEVKYVYTETNTRRSGSVQSNGTITEIDGVSGDTSKDGAHITDAELTDLSAGVQYTINNISMKNDINPGFGDIYPASGDLGLVNKFTFAPSSQTTTVSDSNIIATGVSKNKNILDPSDGTNTGEVSGTYHYLINTSTSLLLDAFDRGTIEVSMPSNSLVNGNVESNFDDGKLGSGLDDESDIIVINTNISGGNNVNDDLEILKLHGFVRNSVGANATIMTPTNVNDYCDDPITSDPYQSTNNRGFRIHSTVPLNRTITADMLNTRAPADDQIYTLQYTLTRHGGQGGGSVSTSVKFFRDDLTVDPTSDVGLAENGVFVNSIQRVGGLPSVNEVDISLNCAFTNLCSSHKLVNADRNAGTLTTTPEISSLFSVTSNDANNNYKFIDYGDVAPNKTIQKQFFKTPMTGISYSTTNNGAHGQNWDEGDKTLSVTVTSHNLKTSDTADSVDFETNFLKLTNNHPSTDSYFFKEGKAPADDGANLNTIDLSGAITDVNTVITSWNSISTTAYDFSSVLLLKI